jgi:cell division protein FtsB
MKVDLGILGKLTTVALILLALSFVLGVAVWYMPVIQHNERMRKEILRLEQEVRDAEEQNRRYKAAIDAISKDPKTIERLARERLRYAKPGETVFVFESPAPTNSGGRP